MNATNEKQSPNPSVFRDGFLKNKRLIWIIVSVLLLLTAITALVFYFYYLPRDRGAERPLVLIHSPAAGEEVPLGEMIQVHATARDSGGIIRMEFWVNGEMEDVQTSSLEDGLNPFPMLVTWRPDREGEQTLTFRAFNSQGVRSQSSIDILGVVGADRDRDGLDDGEDACPDVYGAGEDGCPLPGDGDGDGVSDEEDLCLDAPGDEDDLGCPDRDGDGVPDHLDADPDEAGPAELEGAPDADGDLVPDDEDLAPSDPGDPGSGGAPESGAGDRDGDGASDDFDPCPDDPGLPEDGYCPPPEEDTLPEDEDPGGAPGEAGEFVPLEVEAYQFTVNRDYQNIWCYVEVGPLAMEQYDFQPQGERDWNIAEALSGENSVHLGLDPDLDLDLYLYCMGNGAEDGLLHEIGEYEFQHSRADWNGRALYGVGAGSDGDSFVVRYRICSPSCEATEIQPPILDPITLGPRGEGPYRVRWRWDGDPEWLQGFEMRINGNLVSSSANIPPDRRALDLADYVPQCGEMLAFQLYAIGPENDAGLVEYSPPSNIRAWDGGTCPRTVLVSFAELDPSGRTDNPGPIYGSFYANDQRLQAEFREGRSSFDGTDDPEWYLDRPISIPLMFEEIEREAWSCIGGGCTTNYAPSSSGLEVNLSSRQSLTVGASIWTPGSRLFEGYETIPAGEIVPGPYVISNNGIDLTVMIDVLVGPEAGGEDNLPDLVVTGLDREEESGQLQIQVFNNAADLIREDIPVSIVRMSTAEELYLKTWEDVTIPSGSSVTLMSSDVVLDSPYDLRIMVDPVDPAGDGGIRETNELNNIYETPVQMRVHINGFRVWQPCESFLDTYQKAEFRFRVWVSHRSPEGEVTLVREIAHPWAGTLDYYWGEHEGEEHIGEWDLHDNEGFTFEVEMPPDHALTVHADAYEDDAGTTTDDYAGWILESYGPDENYGDSDSEYGVVGQGWHECHDGTPLGWDENTFLMYYTITRVH